MKTIGIDANIIIRFLLNDDSVLFQLAKSIFLKAQNGELKIYLDEVIIAEVVWTLSSYYKIEKVALVDRLEKLISQDWIINTKKKEILKTFHMFRSRNLSYIDCWIATVCTSLSIKLETFDAKLRKLMK